MIHQHIVQALPDCVIIGAGHNGLIAAAYLARAGKRVCVFERRPITGGCSVRQDLVQFSVPSTIVIRLRLDERGFSLDPKRLDS